MSFVIKPLATAPSDLGTKDGSPGSGVITRVFPKFAFLTPDQKEYGSNVFLPCEAAGVSDLHHKFKVGDRVKFVYMKSRNPNGCQWVATSASKSDGSTKSMPMSTSVNAQAPKSQPSAKWIPNCEGTVKEYQYGDHGRITIRSPLVSEAFFSGDELQEPTSEPLRIAFPVGTPVIFDLEYFVLQNGQTSRFARNVRRKRIDPPKAPMGSPASKDIALVDIGPNTWNLGSSPAANPLKTEASPHFDPLSITDDFLQLGQCLKSIDPSPVAPVVKELKAPPAFLDRQRLRPISSASQPLANRATQTDPITELSILSRLLNDKEVFNFVCPRYPDLIHQWITRSANDN